MTDLIEETLRREQALELERLRLALRKASRLGQLKPADELAWSQLGVPRSSVPEVCELLQGIALAGLREMKGKALEPASLDALGVVKDSLSGAPAPALPLAVRRLLHMTLGPGTAAIICALGDAGLQAVPPDDLPAVRILARDEPSRADEEVLQSGLGLDWRLFADAALLALDRPPLGIGRLLNLWDPRCVFDPGQSAFYRRLAFYRAYHLTRKHNFEAAWEQAQEFGSLASRTTTPLEKEVINLRAYLMLIRDGDTSLQRAIKALRQIDRSPIAKQNLDLLRKRKIATLNERGPIQNPYLALGVDHGARTSEWRRAWLTARSPKHQDIGYLSDVNEARDQIMALERDGSDGAGRVFMVPLSKEFALHVTPHAPSGRLAADQPRTPIFHNDEQAGEVTRKLGRAALHELLTTLDASRS